MSVIKPWRWHWSLFSRFSIVHPMHTGQRKVENVSTGAFPLLNKIELEISLQIHYKSDVTAMSMRWNKITRKWSSPILDSSYWRRRVFSSWCLIAIYRNPIKWKRCFGYWKPSPMQSLSCTPNATGCTTFIYCSVLIYNAANGKAMQLQQGKSTGVTPTRDIATWQALFTENWIVPLPFKQRGFVDLPRKE